MKQAVSNMWHCMRCVTSASLISCLKYSICDETLSVFSVIESSARANFKPRGHYSPDNRPCYRDGLRRGLLNCRCCHSRHATPLAAALYIPHQQLFTAMKLQCTLTNLKRRTRGVWSDCNDSIRWAPGRSSAPTATERIRASPCRSDARGAFINSIYYRKRSVRLHGRR